MISRALGLGFVFFASGSSVGGFTEADITKHKALEMILGNINS